MFKLVISSVPGKIELEHLCRCYGYPHQSKCKICDGTGVVLTEEGETIVALVKKYWDKVEVDS